MSLYKSLPQQTMDLWYLYNARTHEEMSPCTNSREFSFRMNYRFWRKELVVGTLSCPRGLSREFKLI